MMAKQFYRHLKVVFTALLLTGAVSAHAMTASQKVEVERVVTLDNGAEVVQLEAPKEVVPGDKLVYTVDYENTRSAAVENFQLDMPIPEELIYLEGSAQGQGATVLYSIDGGQNFKARNALIVTENNGRRRAATGEDITHIRWILSADVLPGQGGAIKFKGILR